MDIEKYLNQQLKQIDIRELVVAEVHTAVTDDIRRKISEVIKTKINSIIDDEIELVLSEGITTDDGWGKRVQYTSFEELFKKEFREKMNGSWEVKNTIDKSVREKVNKLFTNEFQAVTDKIISELVKKGIEKE